MALYIPQRPSLLLSTAAALLLSFAPLYGQSKSTTHSTDTLSRELLLERDFAPTQGVVRKSFFSPLDGGTKRTFQPLDFALDSYDLSMRLAPRVVQPVEQPRRPQVAAQNLFVRLYGGYPLNAGGHAGLSWQQSDKIFVDLSLRHDTQQALLPASPWNKQLQSHDTELALHLSHRRSSGALDVVRATVYYDLKRLHGIEPLAPYLPAQIGQAGSTPHLPLLSYKGGQLEWHTHPSPSLSSDWAVSSSVVLSLGAKHDPSYLSTAPATPTYHNNKSISTAEFSLAGHAQLKYLFSDTWSVGTSLAGDYKGYPYGAKYDADMTNALLAGVAPFVALRGEDFSIHAGALLQANTLGPRRLSVAPDVRLSARLIPQFSLSVRIDGGQRLYSIRELYQHNPYFYTPSFSGVKEDALYRASLGFDLGNFNGFSLHLRGGYARYRSWADWSTRPMEIMVNNVGIGVTSFDLRKRHYIGNTFVHAAALAQLPIGLRLSVEGEWNQYHTDPADGQGAMLGLPALRLQASGAYAVTSRFTAQLSYLMLAGIQAERHNTPSTIETLSPVNELNAELSYRLSQHIAFGLIGSNLFNTHNTRWLNYEQPGTSISASATFTF